MENETIKIFQEFGFKVIDENGSDMFVIENEDFGKIAKRIFELFTKSSVSFCVIPKGWASLTNEYYATKNGEHYTIKHGFTEKAHKQYHSNGKDFTYIAKISDMYKGGNSK